MGKVSKELMKKNQKVSLTLFLKEPAYSLLSELRDRTGASSKAEVVRRALAHYDKCTRKEKKMSEKYTKQFYVAGVKFRKGWKENLKKLEEGQSLRLVPEPTNRFDPNAIQVCEESEESPMIGYVPAKTGEAVEVSTLLKAGRELVATLIELQPDFEPWKALLIEVKEI